MLIPSPSVTVVVCSRDRADQLRVALPSVRAALRPGDELIVVDSASKSGETIALARSLADNAIRIERPGLSRARNAGIEAARRDIIAFTDDDCQPDPDWLNAIRGHFADSSVVFVTGRVAPLRGEGQTTTLTDEHPRRFTGVQDPFRMGHGANMAFRRTTLTSLGGFDEALGAGAPLRAGEDVDMLFRCLAAGCEGRYEPRAIVAHDQWRDAATTVRLFFGYGLGNGAFRLKAARIDRRAGIRLIARSLWRQCLVSLYYGITGLEPRGILNTLSWTSGMVVGMARGSRWPLDGPNYRP